MLGNFITSLVEWFVTSSKNPEQTSLMFKGTLTTIVTMISISAGLGHIEIPVASLTPIVDQAVQFVQAVMLLAGLMASIYGAIRKVYLTSKVQPAII